MSDDYSLGHAEFCLKPIKMTSVLFDLQERGGVFADNLSNIKHFCDQLIYVGVIYLNICSSVTLSLSFQFPH